MAKESKADLSAATSERKNWSGKSSSGYEVWWAGLLIVILKESILKTDVFAKHNVYLIREFVELSENFQYM